MFQTLSVETAQALSDHILTPRPIDPAAPNWKRMIEDNEALDAIRPADMDPDTWLVLVEATSDAWSDNRPSPFAVEGSLEETLADSVFGSTVPDEDFWDARPLLSHIKTVCRDGDYGPQALLGHLVQHALDQVSFDSYLLTGHDRTVLNTSHIYAGATASGKSRTMRAVHNPCLFTWQQEPSYGMSAGSGAAIRDAYKRATDDEGWITEFPPNHARIFHLDEGTMLEKIMDRPGEIYGEMILGGTHGEKVGQALASTPGEPERTMNGKTIPAKPPKVNGAQMKAGDYRFAFGANIQWSRAGFLVKDENVGHGFTARFLFLSTDSPWLDDMTPVPDYEPFALPDFSRVPSITAPEYVRTAQRSTMRLGQRAGLSEADSHASTRRAVLAAAFAILDDRSDITWEDWQLAGTLLRWSRENRSRIEATQVKVRRATNEAVGRDRAHARVAEESEIDSAKVEQAVAKIDELVRDGLDPLKARNFTASLRPYLAAARELWAARQAEAA